LGLETFIPNGFSMKLHEKRNSNNLPPVTNTRQDLPSNKTPSHPWKPRQDAPLLPLTSRSLGKYRVELPPQPEKKKVKVKARLTLQLGGTKMTWKMEDGPRKIRNVTE